MFNGEILQKETAQLLLSDIERQYLMIEALNRKQAL